MKLVILKNLLPNEKKVNITIDEIRLKSRLTTNKTVRFTKKILLYKNLGFTQPHSGPLSVIPVFCSTDSRKI